MNIDKVTWQRLRRLLAMLSANGKFGGVRCANTSFFASRGLTGLYAPGVQFTGPVYVGDIDAFDDAEPVLMLGLASGETQVNGGDLSQTNGRAIDVSRGRAEKGQVLGFGVTGAEHHRFLRMTRLASIEE